MEQEPHTPDASDQPGPPLPDRSELADRIELAERSQLAELSELEQADRLPRRVH